jgi:cell division protein FtsW
MKEKLFSYLEGDRIIWIIAMIFGLVSILAVYSSISSLAHKFQDGNTFYFLLKHGLMLLSGFGIMYLVHKANHKYIYRLSQLLVWFSALLLFYTLLFGTEINDSKRWITIPLINQSFQTSDLAKIVLIAYVARLLSQKKEQLSDFKQGVLPIMLPIMVIVLLILPANFSTAFLLLSTCFIMMFLAGVRIQHLLSMVAMGIAGFFLFLALGSVIPGLDKRVDTWKSRLASFVPESAPEKVWDQNTGMFVEPEVEPRSEMDLQRNYQVEMAKIAIHRGGLLPNGPGKGTSRNYMPHPYSDMIYAFIIEEYGSLIGGIGLVLLYVILLFRILRIASRTEKKFSAYLALGLGFLLVLQALANMAVAVNLIPVTGQPLPLVSMGGTSLWFTCLALGIILSISRENQLPPSHTNTKRALA